MEITKEDYNKTTIKEEYHEEVLYQEW